jgi:hypothetical protein
MEIETRDAVLLVCYNGCPCIGEFVVSFTELECGESGKFLPLCNLFLTICLVTMLIQSLLLKHKKSPVPFVSFMHEI